MKRVFNIVGNAAMWLFLAFAVTVTVFMFSSSSSDDGFPTLFGKVFIPIEAEVGIEGVSVGDLIIVDEKAEDTLLSVEAGKVLVFTQKDDDKEVLKIDGVKETKVLKNGNIEVKFENVGKMTVNVEKGTLDKAKFIAEYSGNKVPGVGGLFGFLVSSTGFVSIVIIPLVLLFLFELFNYVIAVMRRPRPSISDEERREIEEKAIAEYLKKQAESENM